MANPVRTWEAEIQRNHCHQIFIEGQPCGRRSHGSHGIDEGRWSFVNNPVRQILPGGNQRRTKAKRVEANERKEDHLSINLIYWEEKSGLGGEIDNGFTNNGPHTHTTQTFPRLMSMDPRGIEHALNELLCGSSNIEIHKRCNTTPLMGMSLRDCYFVNTEPKG